MSQPNPTGPRPAQAPPSPTPRSESLETELAALDAILPDVPDEPSDQPGSATTADRRTPAGGSR